MKTNTSYTTPEPTEAELQKQAYYLWLESGRPEGRALEHWDAAREILRHSAPLHDEDDRRKVASLPRPIHQRPTLRRAPTPRALSLRGASGK